MAEAVGSLVRVDIGQERNIAGIFDRSGEIPLLFGGEVRDPAGQDFAALGDEFTQEFGVFVIDGITGFDGREAFAEITHGLNCSVRESKEFKGAIAPSKAKKSYLVSLCTVCLLQWVQNFLISIRPVVFRRFFIVV